MGQKVSVQVLRKEWEAYSKEVQMHFVDMCEQVITNHPNWVVLMIKVPNVEKLRNNVKKYGLGIYHQVENQWIAKAIADTDESEDT